MGEAIQAGIIEFRIISETLFLTFLILKLTGVITWSWWWVFAPILVIAALILILLMIILCYKIIEKRNSKANGY